MASAPFSSDVEKSAKRGAGEDKDAEVVVREEQSTYVEYDQIESAAVDQVYKRKVYIFNKVMNEHIGMNKVRVAPRGKGTDLLSGSTGCLVCPALAGSSTTHGCSLSR